MNRVITSFNEEGYKRYGQEFIKTFQQFWPTTVGLTVYYEGENWGSPDFPFSGGLSWRPIEEVEFLKDYLDGLRFPIMHGIVGQQFDMNFDARQARKVFIEMHAMKHYGGKVFWVDADTVTTAPVPETLLDDLLPDDAFSCYLGRDGWYHTESGFIGFNANHPIARRFAKNYLNTCITGVNLTLPGWHDCYVYDAVRQILGNGPEFVNLAAHLPHGTMHVQINTILGRYMTHLKGNRKDTKKLREGDLIVTH